ncbi:MAG: Na/Pi cotransporter family protein [Lachnospiraceae bacterium]|nr:Na/Pi cotransporter family protein [Lachnospiraceae bacterium]
MYIFNAISLLGGLALFLYGMRLMSSNLKEGSSGTLKVVMEKVTNNPLKAFILGVAVTAIIQSSTATIVITSGLVAAGIISLRQSLGIIIGANVGTTVTGQIIRLLDVNADGNFWLRFFQPVTLAPLALIIGISLIMFFKFNKSDNIGNIAIGFGVLFTGLLNMTAAVSEFSDNGMLGRVFLSLGDNPVLGYLAGAGVAFVLQSSSATIGILQAFSIAGGIPFRTIYVVLVGIYLGDCVTTAIVCSIGAKADARRVGIVNILFNLSETITVLVVVGIIYRLGLLDSLWNRELTSGGIANTNTVFNLGCAIVLFPLTGVYEKLSRKIVKDEAVAANKYAEQISALNPVFFSTPALAFRSCYNVLITMLEASYANIEKALGLVEKYDEAVVKEIYAEEENIDYMTDCVDNYLVKLSPHVSEELHIKILNQYHRVVSEFEHLGDHAVHIADAATSMKQDGIVFSGVALREMEVVEKLLNEILEYTRPAFIKRDVNAAYHIEPLEEVIDEMIDTVHDNHLARLREGTCSIPAGVIFMNILSNIGSIADTCSNIGIATITRANENEHLAHSYVTGLHAGQNSRFNKEFDQAHKQYYKLLEEVDSAANA